MRYTWIILLVVLAACQPATPETASLPDGVQAKQLATVPMSPTPDAAQQQATRFAQRPTQTTLAPTAAPTATVYVGVFLEPANDLAQEPLVNLDFGRTLPGAEPTTRPSRCTIVIGEAFNPAWQADDMLVRAMACPIQEAQAFTGTAQVFERGVMYFQPGGRVWAIAPGSPLEGQYWFVPQLPAGEFQVTEIPPAGLRLPELGFGSVWRGVDGVRDALGYARLEEQSVNAVYQQFNGGLLLADITSGLTYVLLADGSAYGPY